MPVSEALIHRLLERIRHEPSVDMDQCPPTRPDSPVTEAAVAQAESELGFPLPPLLRALYTRVADGGYGPGRGFLTFAGDEWSLVERAKSTCSAAEEVSDELWWPPRLVEVVSWGGHYMSCVDCSRPSCPVIFYDHDCNIEGALQADYLYPEADSLEGWLWAWLDGVDLWAAGPKAQVDDKRSGPIDHLLAQLRDISPKGFAVQFQAEQRAILFTCGGMQAKAREAGEGLVRVTYESALHALAEELCTPAEAVARISAVFSRKELCRDAKPRGSAS
jgi:hypothetical protein